MKKFLLTILFILLFSCPLVFAIDESSVVDTGSDRFKISLEQAMNLALDGNIEIKEQSKNLEI